VQTLLPFDRHESHLDILQDRHQPHSVCAKDIRSTTAYMFQGGHPKTRAATPGWILRAHPVRQSHALPKARMRINWVQGLMPRRFESGHLRR